MHCSHSIYISLHGAAINKNKKDKKKSKEKGKLKKKKKEKGENPLQILWTKRVQEARSL